MMNRNRKISLIVLAAVLILAALPSPAIHAAVQCTASITPVAATPTTSPTFDITINNSGDADLQWVDLSALSANLKYAGNYISGWSAAEHGDGITLNGNTLGAGQSATFTLQATIGLKTSPANHWRALVSTDNDGASLITCGGNLDVAITGHPPNDADNGVTAIAAAGITTSSATLTWSSDSATTSIVYYGTSGNYGSVSALSPSLDNDHSVTLTGLSPNTIYHFQVAGDDGQWSFAYSGDSTFVTVAGSTTTAGNSPAAATNVPGAVLKPVPTEKTPPTISLITDLARPFSQAPVISGLASDNEALASIEYSTDGGGNWQPVAAMSPTGKRNSHDLKFSFTPVLVDDGNYIIQARATDTSANSTVTAPATLVIDRLAPQAGPLAIVYGSQLLQPDDATGVISMVAGSDYRVTTSAVGGPVMLSLDARPISDGRAPVAASATFALAQTPGSGLWSGALGFKAGGMYELVARALDGAGNRSERVVMTLNIATPGKITESGSGRDLAGAQLILHYREPASGHWQIWEGRPYHQTNPQTTGPTGTYSLVAPRGTYYLEVKKSVHYSFVSNIFTINQPQAIAAPISLGSIPHLTLGSFTLALLPNIVLHTRDLPATASPSHLAANPLIGTVLPDFNLPRTTGGTQSALGLAGKPTLVTLLSTWSPDSQAEISQLAAAQANPDINIAPIFSQEHVPLVTSYLDSAGYHLNALVDADGILVKPLHVGPVPQHIFIDSTGRIKKIMTGVFTKDELLLQLGGL